MARKHASKALFRRTGVVPISKAKFDRAMRNHRCTTIGRDEGGATFKCGRQIVSMDAVNDHYYRVTGKAAMRAAYEHKHRTRWR